MPSVDKAIINPFEPLDVGEALLVAVSGLLIVFVMLAMLMAVILVILPTLLIFCSKVIEKTSFRWMKRS